MSGFLSERGKVGTIIRELGRWICLPCSPLALLPLGRRFPKLSARFGLDCLEVHGTHQSIITVPITVLPWST